MLGRRLVGVKPQSGILFKRYVVVPASNRTRRRRKDVGGIRKDVSVEELELDKALDLRDPKELEFKLRQLREFTKNLAAQIRVADDLVKKEAAQNEYAGKSKEEDADDAASVILGTHSNLRHEQRLLLEGKDLSSIILSVSHQVKKLLPETLLKRINDDELVLRSLINHRNSDWNAIISKLHKCPEKLDGVSQRALKKYVLAKAKNLSLESIRKADAMLLSNIDHDLTKFSTSMYEFLFYNLSNLKPSQDPSSNYNKEIYAMMESLLDRYDEAQKIIIGRKVEDEALEGTMQKIEMNQFILNCCIKFASRLLDASKMNSFLSKFNNDYHVLPNRENYTVIAQFYTKLGLNDKAWDIFATMKFLSAEHKPDAKTYTCMLSLCNREKNYAKAIDLFNEMIDLKVDPTAETLNALVKTLATVSGDPVASEGKAESLRLLAWKYLHQNEDLVNLKSGNFEDTILAMMSLCAYDGDVGLARALYFRYITTKFKSNSEFWRIRNGDHSSVDYKRIWARTLNPLLLNYLMLAYANYLPSKLPLLLGFEQGAITRRNLINNVDYLYKFQNDDAGPRVKLPMLPLADINQPSQILLESRAVWQFNLEFGGLCDLRIPPSDSSKILKDLAASAESIENFSFQVLHQIALWKTQLVNHNALNPKSLMTYLTIPVKLGDKKEFLLRVSEFSYEQQAFEKHILSLYVNAKQQQLGAAAGSDTHSTRDEIKKQLSDQTFFNEETNIAFLSSMKHKIIRNSSIYELTMKAAIKFQDQGLATQAWESRGSYRKTLAFQNLPVAERAKKDAAFASLMVDFFTQQQMYTDAMGIIMASQRHIRWSYPMVKRLHRKLVELEDTRSIKILMEIMNKRSKSDNRADAVTPRLV
ncbi:LAQU0S07e03862g1_1 [Lachancea quebecensis]|uniref:LAQU0S07e03862g1_1 n=1 Tax=Lachancea quebecensis TaxID=1654605 RepID=A0A0P1KST3_9SACH|nr:LAQU0S07e03862g1_1 [Lachancea quebecensis]